MGNTSDVYILRRYREAEDDVGPYLEAILGVGYRFQFAVSRTLNSKMVLHRLLESEIFWCSRPQRPLMEIGVVPAGGGGQACRSSPSTRLVSIRCDKSFSP